MRIGTLGVASAAVRFAGQTDRGLVRLPPDSLASLPPQHLGRRHRLVKPRIGYEQVRAQPRAILHQCMGTQRQLRRLPTASARQLRLRSVVLSCVSLLRRSPLKSTIPVPSPPSFGGRPPFFFKLLKLAHDSMSVQSTVKCSVDNSRCPFCEPQNLFEEATSDVGFHQLLPHSRKVQLITTRLPTPYRGTSERAGCSSAVRRRHGWSEPSTAQSAAALSTAVPVFRHSRLWREIDKQCRLGIHLASHLISSPYSKLGRSQLSPDARAVLHHPSRRRVELTGDRQPPQSPLRECRASVRLARLERRVRARS